MEKRHNYVRKVAEVAVQCFITNDKANVSGLILAGSADFKTELGQSDMFDLRLQQKILKVVDVSYGGENGLNQAIELSAEVLSNVKFIQEKKLIGKDVPFEWPKSYVNKTKNCDPECDFVFFVNY